MSHITDILYSLAGFHFSSMNLKVLAWKCKKKINSNKLEIKTCHLLGWIEFFSFPHLFFCVAESEQVPTSLRSGSRKRPQACTAHQCAIFPHKWEIFPKLIVCLVGLMPWICWLNSKREHEGCEDEIISCHAVPLPSTSYSIPSSSLFHSHPGYMKRMWHALGPKCHMLIQLVNQ